MSGLLVWTDLGSLGHSGYGSEEWDWQLISLNLGTYLNPAGNL